MTPTATGVVDKPVMYKSSHLTTHAVCVGMTGSGKTGLCIDLLEEAALNGLPAVIIDPKEIWVTCVNISGFAAGGF